MDRPKTLEFCREVAVSPLLYSEARVQLTAELPPLRYGRPSSTDSHVWNMDDDNET
jgi:hypothetical protein